MAILSSKELIALDQDPLGFAGRVVFDSDPSANATSATPRVQVYGKKLESGSVGVVLLNRGDATADISLEFQAAWITAHTVRVRDLWKQADLGTFTGKFTAKAVPAHGHVALSLTAAK